MIFQVLPSQILPAPLDNQLSGCLDSSGSVDLAFLELLDKALQNDAESEKSSKYNDGAASTILLSLLSSFVPNAVMADDNSAAAMDNLKGIGESARSDVPDDVMPCGMEAVAPLNSCGIQELSSGDAVLKHMGSNAEANISLNDGDVTDNRFILPLQYPELSNPALGLLAEGNGLGVDIVAPMESDISTGDISSERLVQAATKAISQYAALMYRDGLALGNVPVFSLRDQLPGGIALEVIPKSGGFSVNMKADTAEALRLAENNLYRLVQALQKENIDTDRLMITLVAAGDGAGIKKLESVGNAFFYRGDALSMELSSADEESGVSLKTDIAGADESQRPFDAGMGSHIAEGTDANMVLADKVDKALGQPPPAAFTDLRADNISAELADAVQRFVAEHKDALQGSKLVFQLQPENMGRIVIEMRYAGNQLNAHITADTPSAYQLIGNNLPQLQQILQQSGFNVPQLVLTLGQGMLQWNRNSDGQRGYLYKDRSYVKGDDPVGALLRYDNISLLLGIEDGQNMINQYA